MNDTTEATVGSGVMQSDQDAREARTVKEHFIEARREKERFSKKWGLFWKLVLGRHWPESTQSDFEKARPVIQKTHQAVQTRLAHLTSRRPVLKIISEFERPAELLQRVIDAVWTMADLDYLRSLSVLNSLVPGTGCLKVLWDSQKRSGKGDIDVQAVDPHNIFISAGCIEAEDADQITHAQNITMSRLHRMYDGDEKVKAKLALVKKGPDEPSLSFDVLAEDKGSGGLLQGFGTDGTSSNGTVFRGPADGKAQGIDDDRVTVYEEWTRRDDGKLHVRVVEIGRAHV